MNSVSKYEEIFHNSPCGYLIISKKNKIIEVNQTLVDWLGYSDRKELEERIIQDLMPVSDKIYYETHFYPLILIQKHIKEVNFQLLKKDKSKLPVLVDGKIYEDNDAKEEQFLLSVVDITHRKSYENELKKSKNSFEALTKDLDKNLAMIEKEITKAENVQNYILPKPFYSKEKSFSIETLYKPLMRVSGDIYDFFQIDENIYRIFLADATGHGISAGFQTMSIYSE